MKVGNFLGCHQKPERSFFFKQYQFPVCARCTGLFVGWICGGILFGILENIPDYVWCIFIAIMFIDWLIQFLDIKESTNFRRLATGLLCGIGGVILQLKVIGFIGRKVR